jgi:hypothetical protein
MQNKSKRLLLESQKQIKEEKEKKRLKLFFLKIFRMLASRVSLLHRASFRHLGRNSLTTWMTGF